ncbi:MAG: RapZ C-terminal domain-containing protein [Pseudonocardiaceae bacterium]
MNGFVSQQPDPTSVRIALRSFGFKYGMPDGAHFVVDMRFLPNPFWVPELKPFNGRDERVRDYVLGQEQAIEHITCYAGMICELTERYRRKGKGKVTVAVGCTGGKHRSVVAVEFLMEILVKRGYNVTATHGDLGRE